MSSPVRVASVLAVFALSSLPLFGCGDVAPVAVAGNDDDLVVPEGKEDDFYSSSAQEYWVTGISTVTVEDGLPDAAARLRRAQQLASLKEVAVGWFLNVYLTDKEATDANKSYGGFGALTRFGSESTGTLSTVDGKTFRYSWKLQVGGSKSLMSRVPGTVAAGGGKSFNFQMGRISNADLARLETNHEWYRDEPWASFDPSSLTTAQLEGQPATLALQKTSPDAYLAYDRLYADGKLTIAAHFGWDYWARYDITNSRIFYAWLVAQGFKSPVARYELYDRTSGPLTRSIKSNGRSIVVEVSIFHPGDAAHGVPGPDPDTDDGGKVMESDMRDSLAHREVIIFDGHSGPLYGFALADWRTTNEGDFDDTKIPTAVMPRTYQIVLANGCDTYDLGQAFWKNPAKADRQSLNVITTTDFSNAGTEASVERLVGALVNQAPGSLGGASGAHVVPAKVSDLTSRLDADQGASFTSMYGVHGVDADPKYDPTSNRSSLCRPCTSDASCAGDGNRCTRITSTLRACTFGCIDDTGCPTGYGCRIVASSTTGAIKTRQCIPVKLSCK